MEKCINQREREMEKKNLQQTIREKGKTKRGEREKTKLPDEMRVRENQKEKKPNQRDRERKSE